jgi:hypothetical protein
MLRTQQDGTTRLEDEQWRFHKVAVNQVIGRYTRTVEVHSDDRVPFQCNQRPWYRQRATFDVAVELTPAGLVLRETEYRAEPSPCDHGFRHASTYRAELALGTMVLRWEGGEQTLTQLDTDDRELPDEPWPRTPVITGPWRWDNLAYDDDGNLRTEHEWWEITRRDDARLDITYRRRVVVDSSDGRPIPCAGGTRWTFDDAFVLDGQREEEHWHFHERAAEPGDHPCLGATPARALDEATAEQIGDHLVLEWRGKRRQVLYRPD